MSANNLRYTVVGADSGTLPRRVRVAGGTGLGATVAGYARVRPTAHGRWTRAPPPGCTRRCERPADRGAAVSSRRSSPRILVPPDWPHLPWPGLLSAVQAASPGQRPPISISANEHPLTPIGRHCRLASPSSQLCSVSIGADPTCSGPQSRTHALGPSPQVWRLRSCRLASRSLRPRRRRRRSSVRPQRRRRRSRPPAQTAGPV